MKDFVAISLPEDFAERIAGFQREWGYLPDRPPHVPLLSGGAPESATALRQKLESLCLAQPEFSVKVSSPVIQGGQALALGVMPGQLHMLHKRLLAHLGTAASGKALYRPAVTLLQLAAGEVNQEDALRRAREVFAAPFSFLATTLTVYRAEGKEGPFAPAYSVPFTGR